MNRSAQVTGFAVLAATMVGLEARDASACGGCFHPPTLTVSDITDERMLLSVSPVQSTLYDQIRYSGSPTSFAWVLPIHGTVSVGLSADVLFDSIDSLTGTQITPPPSSCPPPPNCSGGVGCGGVSSSPQSEDFASGSASGTPPVTVTKQQNVGPYDTVQLHATDSSALAGWLAQNGFNIPVDAQPVIDAYVAEGFDFLAMKLLPDQGVQAMRPVRVTTPGASLSLPLRMASVGTGATVGITIWVVADGRYEPQNFPFFHIEDSALIWDWKQSSSNYTLLRSQNETALAHRGWEIESSIDLNEQVISNLILSGGQPYSGGTALSDPGLDYLPETTSSPGDAGADAEGGTAADAGVTMTAAEVRAADISALFVGLTGPTVRVTRVRSDIAHTAMTADLLFRASTDQSELSNVRTVTQSINETCTIYNGCNAAGQGTPEQAKASQKSGCAASTQAAVGASAGSGAFAGLAALLLARTLYGRRRARRGS